MPWGRVASLGSAVRGTQARLAGSWSSGLFRYSSSDGWAARAYALVGQRGSSILG